MKFSQKSSKIGYTRDQFKMRPVGACTKRRTKR
jgi:hypothetical protein